MKFDVNLESAKKKYNEWARDIIIDDNIFQRFTGKLSLHVARPTPLTCSVGMAATACNLYLSNYAALEFERSWDSKFKTPRAKRTKEITTKELVRRVYLGLATYAIIEGGMFRTALPSSSIHLGAYANSRNMLRNSVECYSPVATEAQRFQIQRLGKKFGCHQCGSRQFFATKPFIADHMPPTKYVVEQSARWWRKFLNIKIQQRLWPQCQSCYSVQGQAVRTWSHVPIYHHRFRLHHVSPMIATCLNQFSDIRELCKPAVDPTAIAVDTTIKTVKKYIEQFRKQF